VIGGGILDGGTEHAVIEMTVTKRKTNLKSEIRFTLPTLEEGRRHGCQTAGAKRIEDESRLEVPTI
jgi:hypothetical protein